MHRLPSAESQLVDASGKPMMSCSADTRYTAASRTNPAMRGVNPRLESADDSLIPELSRINARAIDLDRNNGIAQGAREVYRDNVIGTGLNLLPKPNWRVLGWEQDQASEWSKGTKAHYIDWADTTAVDIAGHHTMNSFSRLVCDTKYNDGESVVLPMWKTRPGSRFKTCFKMIQAARLSNPNDKPDTDRLRGGVLKDDDGMPLGYYFRNKLPTSMTLGRFEDQNKWTFVPARTKRGRRRVIHIYQQSRPGQSRGIPKAAAVLAAFGLAGKYQLDELKAAAVNAKVAGIMESNLPQEIIQEIFGAKAPDGQSILASYLDSREDWQGSIEAGSILQLPIGDTFKSHNPGRPATSYGPFMGQIYKEIGAGLGLPPELLTRDFSQTNYSSARAALLEAWRHFYVERQDLETQWYDAAYELWLEEAVDRGYVEAPDFYKYKSAYCRADWRGVGHLPIDPVKHQQSIKIGLETGSLTMEEVIHEKGGDLEEHFDQLEREAKEKEKRGLSALGQEKQSTLPKVESVETVDDKQVDGEEKEDTE